MFWLGSVMSRNCMRAEEKRWGRVTLSAYSLFVVHGEFTLGDEEAGIVVMNIGVVGDGVVFFDKVFDSRVGDGVGKVWEWGRHGR